MSLVSTTQPVVSPITGRDTQASDLGNYYVAVTPTAGTGVVTGNPTTFDETKPMLTLFNAGLLNVYLLYVRLSSTVVGGGAATKNFTHAMDVGNRVSSGGTNLTTNNVNSAFTTKSAVSGTTGAITASAASSQRRLLGNDFFRQGATDVVGDIYEFQYGEPMSAATQQIATAVHFIKCKAPIVIAPQNTYLLHVWSGTFTQGITFEVEVGYVEK